MTPMSEQDSKRKVPNNNDIKRVAGNLQEMLNLGPVTARRLQAVSMDTPADLERVGSVEAFHRVEQEFPHETTLVLLYALEGALQDIPWTTLTEEVKVDLRQRVAG